MPAKKSIFSCKICDQDIMMYQKDVSNHLLSHNITEIDYYHNVLGNPVPEVNLCGKTPPFYSVFSGYGKFCGNASVCKCSSEQQSKVLNKAKSDHPEIIAECNRKKLSVINSSPELRRKSELASVEARRKSDSYRTLRSAFMSKQWTKDIFNSEEARQVRSDNMSRRNKDNWKDPAYRKSMTAFLSDRNSSSEYLEKHRNSRYKWSKYNEINFRSSWEVFLARNLDDKGLKWEYESSRFKYMFEGVEKYYIPDFYINSYDLYVEIHPECFWDEQMNSKLNSVGNIIALKSYDKMESFIKALPINPQISVGV